MSSLAAKIVIVLGIVWMAVVVVLPLVVEAVLLLRTMKEDQVLSGRTKALQVAIFFAVIVYLMLYPGYKVRSHQDEVKKNLAQIYAAQVTYYGEYGTYAGRKGLDGSGCFADLKWEPEGFRTYSYYCGGDRLLPFQRYERHVTNRFDPEGNWPFAIKPSSSQNHFTAMATIEVPCERGFEAWMINDANELRCLTNNEAWTFSNLITSLYFDLICGRTDLIFYPWLIMSALAPFLFLSLRSDYRHYKWVRERASSGEEKKQGRDGDG
jgi:hypothetical protein